jgi:SAM-dependent methyltransferase
MKKEIATKPFTYYNNFYDLLYSDKDYKTEAEYVVSAISSINPNTKNIIELGCGTGNYAKHFCKMGLHVSGIELSPHMVEIAESKAIDGFDIFTKNIIDFDLNKQFDGAVALFHVISYLTTNSDILQSFKNVNKHLKPNGVFLFDVWFTPAVYTQSPTRKVKQLQLDDLEINRIAEPAVNYTDNTVDVNYNMTVTQTAEGSTEVLNEAHTLRHFSTPEIKFFAEATGFTFLRAEEFLTAKAPGADTWGVCYILQKHG